MSGAQLAQLAQLEPLEQLAGVDQAEQLENGGRPAGWRCPQPVAVDYARRHWRRMGPTRIAKDTGWPVSTVDSWARRGKWGPTDVRRGHPVRIDWPKVRELLEQPGANWRRVLRSPEVNTSTTVLRRAFAQRGWPHPRLWYDGSVTWPVAGC